ncbi:MAG TPA: DUF429 domain-containing protein [Ktedonobacteraceae bacterium]|nr:DUF429 domain-containing protein [Ktedonobacteraceae bacterium]
MNRIFGLDFTSAPRPGKPITCARCTLHNSWLIVEDCLPLTSFQEFESFLQQPGPWIVACDFPFGQPCKLLRGLGWPLTWTDYVHLVASMDKNAFEETLTRYQASRPAGDKQHMRVTDQVARSRSPMMLHRVPVAKMFFAGAPRLLASGVSVLPCRPLPDNRIVVEGYPALVARRWLGKRGYKSDERKKQSADQLAARRTLLETIRSNELDAAYGLKLSIPDEMAEHIVQEPMGDRLDAILCAIQAAWSYTQCQNGYGIPPGHEIEGWIVDSVCMLE